MNKGEKFSSSHSSLFVWQSRVLGRGVFLPINDLMRESMEISEVLESALETAQQMQRYRAEMYKELPLSNGLERAYKQQANDYAAFQVLLLRNLSIRSASNQTRLAHQASVVRQRTFSTSMRLGGSAYQVADIQRYYSAGQQLCQVHHFHDHAFSPSDFRFGTRILSLEAPESLSVLNIYGRAYSAPPSSPSGTTSGRCLTSYGSTGLPLPLLP
jgi:hypothetical protein